MTRPFTSHDVAVAGGDLRVAVWEPVDGAADAPTALLIHGVTSSFMAWQWLAEALPNVRLIAPDLRGRGASNRLVGSAGMRTHADDLAAVLDALGVDSTLVVGHSMGAFVSVVFAHAHPTRVTRLLLVDGGLPLDVPADLDPETLVSSILGPTAARLSMRFADVDAYLDFWQSHPGFAGEWTPALDAYFAYDLVDAGDGALRSATSYEVMREDTLDMNTGTALPDALAGLSHPTHLITVPRGLQNEEPGLYSAEHVERVLETLPGIEHDRLDEFNHYTIVMSDAGARVLAPAVERELSLV